MDDLIQRLRNDGSSWAQSLFNEAALRIENLQVSLKECADDLEASINAEYRNTLDYPSQKRKYDRDMGPVQRARQLLK